MALNNRFPPQKFFRVKLRGGYGGYSFGHVFQPTGLWRSELLNRGIIEECPDPNLRTQQEQQPTLLKRGKR